MNNFKRIEEENLRRNPQAPPVVENRVGGSMGLIKTVSNVIELYLPRIFQVIVSMTGARGMEDNAPNSGNNNERPPHHGPSQPPHRQ